MKNRNWLRLTGWLLALVMVMTVMPVATFAEMDGEVNSDTIKSPTMQKRPAEVDVTAVFTYTNAKGNATEPAQMDPNEANQMKLAVSGLNDRNEIGNNTVMAVTLPENITISTTLQGFSSDAVSATLDDGKLLLSWKGDKQDSFEATVAVLPHLPAERDLSGSYVLGTGGNQYYKVMLGTTAFPDTDKPKRMRLSGIDFEEVDGKVYILSEDAAPVWKLEHVSGNYYTVRLNGNEKYLRIDQANNGLILEEATKFTAQKLLVESAGNGYYTFSYIKNNKKTSINNSSFNSIKGFASYNYEKGLNAILKLYSPSDVITEAKHDVSGTWVITNAAKNNIITADKHSTNGRLAAISYTADGERLLVKDEITTFTFQHITRDWYTVKTGSGYLNISDTGAFISDTPQHLAVQTDKQYSSIILTNSEQRDLSFKNVGYVLNNVNGKTSDGYGVASYVFNDNSRLTLVSVSKAINENSHAVLAFDVNGGTGTEIPATIEGESGQRIVLPSLNATKSGQTFIGWAEVRDIYSKVAPDINHTYHVVYKPGTSYTMKAGNNTLYAVYNIANRNVTFGIRKDGVIVDEPNDNSTSDYIGHFTVNGILKECHWVIDINSTKPVNDYYVENNVTAVLTRVPTAEEIAAALKKEGNVDFDPETQYIHYYVLKYAGKWKIDGVIRNKASVTVSYNVNAPAGTDKTKISDMPGSYQITSGTEILIGTDKNSQEIKTPTLKNHVFTGWNTEADGSGTAYAAGNYVRLKSNLNLYAQWADIERNPIITLESDWPQGKPALSGTKITLTAKLFGFDGLVEGEDYYLQWQHSLDTENWTDEPDANAITYTYELNSTTAQYSWRVVARSIQ